MGKIVLFSIVSRPVLGSTHPPIHWAQVPISPVVKWPRHEVTLPLPHVTSWHDVELFKHRGRFTLLTISAKGMNKQNFIRPLLSKNMNSYLQDQGNDGKK
jgi:hypothetical protein